MTRKANAKGDGRGFWAVGIYHPKRETNVGTLLRSAHAFGATFAFTVGRRYQHQSTDTTKAPRHLPLFHFDDVEDLVAHLPHGCPLLGVELVEGAAPLDRFHHPERAAYLLGAEDGGLPNAVLNRCHQTVVIPHAKFCLNVSAAGSIVIYDRAAKVAAPSSAPKEAR